MKAFFGALVLTLASAVAGVFAATGLHEMASSVGGSSAAVSAGTTAATAEVESAPIKQRVNYPIRRGAQPTRPAADDI